MPLPASASFASVDEAMDTARAALGYLAQADLGSLPTVAQARLLRELERAESQHTAVRARALSVFDGQAAFNDDGHGSARTWLIWQTRVTGPAASGAVGWMRRLRAHPLAAGALARGRVSASFARQICEWADLLPQSLRDVGEQILLDAAADGADLHDLSGMAEDMFARACPPDTDDEGDAARFGRRFFRVTRLFRGHGSADGNLTPECLAAVQEVLDTLGRKAGPEDDRTAGQRRHDALEEAMRLLLASRCLPDRAGQPALIQMQTSLEEILARPGAADAARAWLAEHLGSAGGAPGSGAPDGGAPDAGQADGGEADGSEADADQAGEADADQAGDDPADSGQPGHGLPVGDRGAGPPAGHPAPGGPVVDQPARPPGDHEPSQNPPGGEPASGTPGTPGTPVTDGTPGADSADGARAGPGSDPPGLGGGWPAGDSAGPGGTRPDLWSLLWPDPHQTFAHRDPRAERHYAAGAGETGWLTGKAAEAYTCDAKIAPMVCGHLDRNQLATAVAALLAGEPGDPATSTTPAPVPGPRCQCEDRSAPTPGGQARLQDTLLRYALSLLTGPAGLASYLRTQVGGYLASPSLPLDLGEPTEQVPPHLRRAVIKRDRHCSFPGCAAPAVRCHVHHLIPRAMGGPTRLDNLTLLCHYHHLVVIHRQGWSLTLHADGTTTAQSPDGLRILHSHGPPPGQDTLWADATGQGPPATAA